MRSSNLFVIKIPSIIEHRLDPVPPRLRTGNLKYVFSFNCTCSPLKARHGQNMPRCVKKRCLKLAENTMGTTWSTIKFWGTQCFRETNIRNPQDPIVCQQIANNISIQTSHICLSSFPKKMPHVDPSPSSTHSMLRYLGILLLLLLDRVQESWQ